MTKLFALGGVGAIGAGVFAAVRRARRNAAMKRAVSDAFDYGDLDNPVVVSEEFVIVGAAPP
ncbi:MAG TPA: hypothetical protein VFV99_19490 [Kofleriaceae bacterium]|nr:hypothetical protein [Kofleriaceae bacterium]